MAWQHDTMMNPPIEGLLDRADSKFRLVTLGARRARQINSYFGQLGDGLGTIVPPQVTSVARKPLSIAFEEISADKIVAVDGPSPEEIAEAEAAAAADAALARRRLTSAMLAGRRIVLGVTGGIAAYKAIEVCRRLVDAGRPRRPGADQGRGALRRRDHLLGAGLGAGAHVAVRRRRSDPAHPAGPVGRPGRRLPGHGPPRRLYAAGISNDLLTATLLATRAPVVIAPAMHTEMWEHPAVQDNLRLLASRGVRIVATGGGPPRGRRPRQGSSGRSRRHRRRGRWRCSAPRTSAGLHVLVTAGGTREPIDPVRFIGNRSSGKQGHALAEEAWSRGAKVTLVTTTERPVSADVDVVRVVTAAEMEQAVLARAPAADVVVMAAAVADFRPAQPATGKIKKADGVPVGRPRADPRHPRRARCGQAAHPDPGRLRRRDQRRPRPRRGEAGPQGPRPHRRQRRQRPARRLRARHEPGHDRLGRRRRGRGRAGRQTSRGRGGVRRHRGPPPSVCRPALTAPRLDRSPL